jgi:hypothetical protein
LCQKYWRTQKCINEYRTENIHKYLQQQNQAKLIAKNHQNIGTCLKYLHMHKILALAQNVGGLSKYRRQMYAANVCVKCLRQMFASNVGGFPKYTRQMLASNLCGIMKLLRHIIYDRNKADVEISAPIKIYAPNVCVHQKIGAQTLTIWARQNLQLLTSSKSG